MNQIAVFTDLDGTFLDHHTYSFDEALPTVQWLKDHHVALFAVSSKTLAEQRALFNHLKLFDGYIAENGGVLQHHDQVVHLGPTRAEIDDCRAALVKLLGHSIDSFRPECLEQVIAHTGLSAQAARLACQRECSDPLMLKVDDEKLHKMQEVAKQKRLILVHGGRFLTLCGVSDKANAMKEMLKLHFLDASDPLMTVALGDSPNDLSMLRAASVGVLMQNPDGTPIPETQTKGLRVVTGCGPRIWAQQVHDILSHRL